MAHRAQMTIEERLQLRRDQALSRWLAGQAGGVMRPAPARLARERTSKVRVFMMMVLAMVLAAMTGHSAAKP